VKIPAILVVDPDAAACEGTSRTVRQMGYFVHSVPNGLQAILAIESDVPDLVISEIPMAEMDGLEFLLHVTARWPGLPVVMLTSVGDVGTIVEAVERGAMAFLVKPASAEALHEAVRKGLRIRAASPSTPSSIPEIVGISKGMVEVRRLIALAASSDVNVLIAGETGTGKEHVARAIHSHSRQSGGAFVVYHCAATPHGLFEDRLLLEQANGGVLFLKEVDALTPSDQAKLIRVLDDREVRPVVCDQIRRASFRLLSGTSCDVRQVVAVGRLREDLYHRLSGLVVMLPPLRDRPEDIPILARHFLGPEDGSFAAEALEALCAFSWPGNVSQLRNVVQTAKALAGKRTVGLPHLALPAPTPAAGRLKDVERHAILTALASCRGNLSRTALALGIDRSTLKRKLRRFRTEGSPERQA